MLKNNLYNQCYSVMFFSLFMFADSSELFYVYRVCKVIWAFLPSFDSHSVERDKKQGERERETEREREVSRATVQGTPGWNRTVDVL